MFRRTLFLLVEIRLSPFDASKTKSLNEKHNLTKGDIDG